ncbi:MAG: pilin [Xanthomonadaceae bacterium]|nr:pilin [Xanthomonadaceae bacterium]MDE2258074.1 pilin [Xanthomonadaceae bacterium]
MSIQSIRKTTVGFTLIELMIVVAIIAILAAIAIPAYQNYVIRSQVSEGLSLTDGAKTAMEEFYVNTGRFPWDNTSAGLPQAASIIGTYVIAVQAGTGGVRVIYGGKANQALQGKRLILSPIVEGGSIAWNCMPKSVSFPNAVPNEYLPSSCRK